MRFYMELELSRGPSCLVTNRAEEGGGEVSVLGACWREVTVSCVEMVLQKCWIRKLFSTKWAAVCGRLHHGGEQV